MAPIGVNACRSDANAVSCRAARLGEPVKNVVLVVANRRGRLVTDPAPVQIQEKLIERNDYITAP
jgi:hypothetical protein